MATNSEEGTSAPTKKDLASGSSESSAVAETIHAAAAGKAKLTTKKMAPKKASAPVEGKSAEKKTPAGAVKAKAALTKASADAVKAIKAARKESAYVTCRGGAAGAEAVMEEVAHPHKRLKTEIYEKALAGLQVELVKLQEWIKFNRLKVVVIFEGRDAAGKGGCIKRITESLSPRVTKVVALPAPTEREQSQWYFQRYVQHLPAAGEMVLMDRSWYNRAGVEKVMGFCTPEEHSEFLRSCPEFERMLVRSGIILIKYWFSISNEEQERRFRKRIYHPTKHWKLSPMDLQSRARWVEYSKAKDEMFAHTDIKQAPWYVVHGDDKERARINVMTHLLSLIDYQDLTPQRIELPPRQEDHGYVRPPMSDQTFIPEIY